MWGFAVSLGTVVCSEAVQKLLQPAARCRQGGTSKSFVHLACEFQLMHAVLEKMLVRALTQVTAICLG